MASLKGRVKKLERGARGDRTEVVCPECGEEFTLYGDPLLEYLAYEWQQGYKGQTYGPPTDPAVVKMAAHEHNAGGFIDKATGEWWLKDLLGAERWEAAENGA